MKNLPLFIIWTLCITIGCQKDNSLITNDLPENLIDQTFQNGDQELVLPGNVVYISPSGDLTGQTDAFNIEAALVTINPGGTIHLMEGDFYTSRNIIAQNFNGTIEGEGMEHTVINAVRQSEVIGFEAAISPYWLSVGYTNLFANVLQLDNSTGDVVITNLTIRVKDDQPTDVIPDEYGDDATYLSTIIEILGGEHNTLIENVRLEGKESGAFGNVQGMNTAYGIHVMLKPLAEKGKGNLTIRNVDIENTGWGAILFMKYNDSSIINIDEVRANNVGQGVLAGNIDDSSVKISNMDISLREFSSDGMWLFNIPSGLEVSGNSIVNGFRFGIGLIRVANAQIFGNTIMNHHGCCWWAYGIGLVTGTTNNIVTDNKFMNLDGGGGGIFIWDNSSDNIIEKNDFKLSNLPGWTESTPDGPGAIIQGGGTQGNEVFEMKFPPSQGVSICEQISDFTDNSITPAYDGNNFIHHWQPCGNVLEMEIMNIEDVKERQFKKMQIFN